MNITQPVVAIVDGSSYLDRIASVLIRNGFALVTHQSTADELRLDGEHGTPYAVVYCVRDEHASVDRVRQFYERFLGYQPPTRVVVCSGDFHFVQSLRSAAHPDGIVVLYEPFDVEALLEAIAMPNRQAALTSCESI